MSFTWDKPPSQAWNTRIYIQSLRAAVLSLFEMFAIRIEGSMKIYATWQDRTGNARQRLECEALELPDGTILIIARQKMDYGRFLETKNPIIPEIVGSGKFAIIMPTLEDYYRPIWAATKRVVS